MTPGPLPKPTAIKEAEGNPGKKKIKKEPKPPALTESTPPAFLSSDAVIIWNKQMDLYKAMGVLTAVDLGKFAARCQAQANYERLEREVQIEGDVVEGVNKKGQVYTLTNPKATARDKALDQYIKLGAHFGDTPAARVRLGQAKDEDDELDDFIAKKPK